MVRVVCVAEKCIWKCSVDDGPKYETVVKIVENGKESVLLPGEGDKFVADARAVVVSSEKGVTRIWV